jgi:hypothetical protein
VATPNKVQLTRSDHPSADITRPRSKTLQESRGLACRVEFRAGVFIKFGGCCTISKSPRGKSVLNGVRRKVVVNEKHSIGSAHVGLASGGEKGRREHCR